MTLTPDTLPAKFHPFLLGHPLCPNKSLERQVRDVAHPTQIKPHVFSTEQWMLKKARIYQTYDMHLYRVRKAEKIRAYIRENHLQAHVVVPKKYLYHDGKEFVVVCQKLQLSEEVAEISDEILNDYCEIQNNEGQAKKLNRSPRFRAISPVQAKILAELAFNAGLTDLTYNNLFFTPKGQVAIVDTEPLKRIVKKTFGSFPLIDKSALIATQGFTGTSKLKLNCSSEAARREIEKVEDKHLLLNSAKLISKIAFFSFIEYCIYTNENEHYSAFKIVLISIVGVQLASLVTHLTALCAVRRLSSQGAHGAGVIADIERSHFL